MKRTWRWSWVAVLCMAAAAWAAQEKGSGIHPYPLWPSTPVPGWPGVGVDENTTPEKLADLGGGSATYGQPEFLAYPGSVEHVRRELQRYVPPYPIYNQHTLRKNFILHDMPGCADRCVEFAEPVYYNPMYRARIATTQTRPAVRAFPWKPGSPAITLDLGRLAPSMYLIRPIAAAPTVKSVRPKKYVFIELRINDLPDDAAKMNAYILRAQTLDNFYSLQDFYFQSSGDRDFRAELRLLPESEVDLLLYNIDLHDRFGECANVRGKHRTTLYDADARRKVADARRKEWAEARADKKKPPPPQRTVEEQRAFDDLVWNDWLPPLNCHTGQNLGTGAYNAATWKQNRYCVAPAAWAALATPAKVDVNNDPLGLARRAPLVFRVKGKLYADVHGGLHDEPARYSIKGGTVYRGNVEIGPVADCEIREGSIYFKGEKKGPATYITFRDAELLEDGKPAGKVRIFKSQPGVLCFNKDGRLPFAEEREMAPGLYYDAAGVTSIYSGLAYHDFESTIRAVGAWQNLGDRQVARDEAIKFIRYVYDWPAVRPCHQINNIMGGYGLDRRMYRRYQWWPAHHEMLTVYDSLFEFIDGNQDLAAAVHRYLPWVNTPDDVVKLLDTRLVQDYANDMMKYRYFYDHGQARLMVQAALVQDDRKISDPWMEFLWTRGWEYPQAMSGLADNIITGTDRDGATNVGSIFYAIGGQLETSRLLEEYIAKGGNSKYDLTDPLRYPASRATIYLPFESSPAGRQVLGVGDVGGPSQPYGRLVNLPNMRDIMAAGWHWTHEPGFAYELATTFGRAGEPEAEWNAILAAAKSAPDPYLQQRSRALSDWGGYLEGGRGDPDFRFHRALSVRVGAGYGHAHNDTLDLRVWEHGVTMAGDLGMRPAYGKPKHQLSRVHNVVEVNDRSWQSHAWVSDLFDPANGGTPYLAAQSVAPYGLEDVKLFRRQCALIDVDPGRASAKTPPETDPDVVTPSAYVFDVFRVSGGNVQTYCFHGCVDDGFDVNVKDRVLMTGADNADERYLRGFSWRTQYPNAKPEDKEWAADPAADTLVATWRLSRGPGEYKGSPESRMYSGLAGKHGGAMTAPRKYTRLYLFNQTGDRILHGIDQDTHLTTEHNPPIPYYAGRCLFAQKRGAPGQELQTAFVALIEPYAGEPYITAAQPLAVEDNETDAQRAVAVEVITANGHTDVCFADGRPDKSRSFRTPHATFRISAEYAYVSRDAQGLRQATLAGGRVLHAGDMNIDVKDVEYGGKVVAVDCLNRRVTLDGVVPGKRFAGAFFEAGGDCHKTSYEVSGIEQQGGQTALTLRKGIEVMRSHITKSDPATGRLKTTIAMLRFRGRDQGLMASNDDATKFWRVAYLGGDRHEGHDFELTPMAGGKAANSFPAADFSEGGVLRVWEFGVGDAFHIRTGVSLRRVAPNVYGVSATSPFQLRATAKGVSLSRDRNTWQAMPGAAAEAGVVTVTFPDDLIDAGTFYIRLER